MSRVLLVALPLVAGCDFFDNAKDAFSGLTNPMVALGTIVAVEDPDGFDLSSSGFDPGTSLSLFLADAANANELENAPVSGATVSLQGVSATDTGNGVYLIGPDAGPAYVVDATWTVSIGLGDGSASMRVVLPPPADFDAPDQHDPNTALTLDLTGQDFDAFIGVVIESSSGTVTWSTEPEDIGDVYQLTHGGGTVEEVVIPGSAFPNEDVYLVGLAGLAHAPDDGMDNVNTLLSSLSAGQMVFAAVPTTSLPL